MQTLSTLSCRVLGVLGNKELFKNCKIYKSNYNWPKHPILYFDFLRIPNRTPQEFEDSLKRTIQSFASEHSLSINVPTLEEGLEALVIDLSKQNKVVILVDEYDKPIINNLKNLEIAEQNRDILKSFFTVLKGLDEYLKFSFMTGVSKFSQVSLFSGPNNVLDISMDKTYSHLMGCTEGEIKHSFSAHMQKIVQDGVFPGETHILDPLRTWYNGLRFF